MSHIFIILVQIPYVILSIFCGISVIISNWHEYGTRKKRQPKTIVLEPAETGIETEQEVVPMAA